MTFSRISLSVAMLLALGAPAFAQMYPGEGIAVNPAAVGGGQVLLYPGGNYVRVVPQLLQPGAPYPGEPIHLHMPVVHHRAVARRKAPEPSIASASEPEISAPVEEAPPPPAPVKRKVKVAATPPPEAPPEAAPEPAPEPAPAQSSKPRAAIPFSFGGPMPRAAQAKPQAPAVAPKAQAPVKVASVQPPPVTTKNAVAQPATPKNAMTAPGEEPSNLSKRSEILFPHNATDPTPEAAGRLKQLAGDLNSALDAGAQRVQLDAFGGAPGDKSTDARRVSLKRALVIRQLLIDAGVPASRIDVRAMGGIDDSGNADRVDVYVRAG
jgi:outer membrane protein OmpA-like peptidoglycan-associated protein